VGALAAALSKATVCWSPAKLNDAGRERIRTLVESSDGFYIAEMDMKLRPGPASSSGTKQSGLPAWQIGNIFARRRHSGDRPQ